MYLIGLLLVLMSLSAIWQMGKCDGQKMLNSSVKNPDKMPKGMKHSDKIPSQFDILFENYGKKIIATKGAEGQKMKKFITELSKKQRMLEAIYGKTTKEESEIYSKDNEYKCLKKRCNEIYRNDPPLSQMLEHLITVQINAKEALEYDNANELNVRLETLKGSLAYAVTFMAQRNKIQLNSERWEKEKVGKRANEQRLLWTELANYYEEFELDKIGKKCHKNSEYYGNKNGKEKKNKGREERFFRFVARTLETKWEGNAFSNGQSGEDDDDDDAIRRRKRRKRRMNAPPPPEGYYELPAIYKRKLILLLIISTIVASPLLILYCANRCRNIFSHRSEIFGMGRVGIQNPVLPPHPTDAGGAEMVTIQYPMPPTTRTIDPAVLTDYIMTAATIFTGEFDSNNMCPNCLAPFEPGTRILPFPPCNHIFHVECIEPWLNVHSNCPLCRTEFKIEPISNGDGRHQVVIDVQSDANNGMRSDYLHRLGTR